MAAPNLQDVIASALTTALRDYLLESEDETRYMPFTLDNLCWLPGFA